MMVLNDFTREERRKRKKISCLRILSRSLSRKFRQSLPWSLWMKEGRPGTGSEKGHKKFFNCDTREGDGPGNQTRLPYNQGTN